MCGEFLKAPHGAYLENSLHARLYHIFALKGLDRRYKTKSGYWMHGVQREYPTIEKEPEKDNRGKFDLAVFDEETVRSIDWWKHDQLDPQTGKGVPIPPVVAIEMGLNKGLAGGRTLFKKEVNAAEKELQRLANPKNRIGCGLLLYFYRYEEDQHKRQAGSLDVILSKIGGWAERETRANSHTTARIVSVRTVFSAGYAPREAYELRVERGHSMREGISPRDMLDRQR